MTIGHGNWYSSSKRKQTWLRVVGTGTAVVNVRVVRVEIRERADSALESVYIKQCYATGVIIVTTSNTSTTVVITVAEFLSMVPGE